MKLYIDQLLQGTGVGGRFGIIFNTFANPQEGWFTPEEYREFTREYEKNGYKVDCPAGIAAKITAMTTKQP